MASVEITSSWSELGLVVVSAAGMLVGIIVGSYSTIYIAAPLVLWLQEAWALSLLRALLALAIGNVVLAGISLRVGGQLAKGPYLPQTLEGISRTTKAVLGR